MTSSEPTLESNRQRILLAEDDELIREVFCQALANCGWDVDAARDGVEAWTALQHDHYDLLITDQDMPGIMGLELIARLRIAGMQLPVIIVSGASEPGSGNGYKDFRLAATLHKPLQAEELVKAAKAVLPRPPKVGQGRIRQVARMVRYLRAARAWPSENRSLKTLRRPSPAVPAREARERLEQSHSQAPEWHQAGGAKAKAREGQHNQVLIVDDDPVVRGSLAAVLESEGFEVREAGDGFGAVARTKARAPDLVLLDLSMPQIDGWETFLRVERIQPLVPVIVITARPHQYLTAVRLGVDAFMEKPLNIPILVKAIKSLTAEKDHEHTRRITNPSFVTRLLGSNNP